MKNTITKKLFYTFLFLFFITGSLSSLNVGISHDEFHEDLNWNFNVDLSIDKKNIFLLKKKSEVNPNKYVDKFYGIGFQIISQPIQYFLKEAIIKQKKVDKFGAKLISKHFVVFSFFFISGLCFYQILKKIIDNRNFRYFSVLIYFLYPYLYGQSLFNPKDIPFMSIWIFCTYLSFNLFEKLLKKSFLSYSNVIIIGISTALLFSTRVTGILILIQYLITFIIFINLQKINLIKFFKEYYTRLITFFLSLSLFIYVFNPLYWNNPLLFIEAINWMTHYYHDVCTNTLGTCMRAKDLPSTYIPIWLSVKLPTMILLGFLLIPFTEKKIFKGDKVSLVFGTVLGTAILIPLLLIFKKVNLYDEIRHLMFLIPFFFIIGVVSLHFFSKKLFYIIGVLTISIFVIENLKIHPYQYVWFNLPSRYIDLTSKFELEYQGISGKEIAEKISTLEGKKLCVLASPLHTVQPFLNIKDFKCFDKWQLVDTNYPRPFLAVQHVRNIKKGKPYNCETIYEPGFKLLFHDKKFITGRLLKCS